MLVRKTFGSVFLNASSRKWQDLQVMRTLIFMMPYARFSKTQLNEIQGKRNRCGGIQLSVYSVCPATLHFEEFQYLGMG